MVDAPMVILIVGPVGVGKTSTAARIAQHPQWEHVSEDDYWVKIKEGKPRGELRTSEEQLVVQRRVLEDVLTLIGERRKVVLEFILYETPPRALLHYQGALSSRRIPVETLLLRAHIDEVLSRMQSRGRPRDADLAQRRHDVWAQLRSLESPHVKPEWVLDTTDISLEDVYQRYFRHLVEIE